MRFFRVFPLFILSICYLPSPIPLKQQKVAHECATFSTISEKYLFEGHFFFPSPLFDTPALYSTAPFMLEWEQFFFQGASYERPPKL
jgi:hypothetical protein